MRGVTIALFLLSLSVFGTFMGAAGVNDALGVGMNSGLKGPAQETTEELNGAQKPSERGGAQGLLGFAVYAMRALSSFFNLFGSVGAILKSWGLWRYPSLANGIQMLVVTTGSLMLIWTARGVIGE